MKKTTNNDAPKYTGKRNKIIFYLISGILSAYVVLVWLFFYQINNYLIFHALPLIAGISFTTVITAIALLMFLIIEHSSENSFGEKLKNLSFASIFIVINFFLIRLISNSDDMGIFAIFIGFIVFPIFLAMGYLAYSKIIKYSGGFSLIAIVLIIQILFGVLFGLQKDAQLTKDFYNQYGCSEYREKIPEMGIKVGIWESPEYRKCQK